jgi:hypothetical protein
VTKNNQVIFLGWEPKFLPRDYPGDLDLSGQANLRGNALSEKPVFPAAKSIFVAAKSITPHISHSMRRWGLS